MSQGVTIKGKTAQGQSVEILVDDLGQLLMSWAAGSVLQGIRKDADTPDAADGQAHRALFNSLGRLKVAAMPGDYNPITGNITAVGNTVVADVGKASNVMIYVTGTFAGHNITFEGSIDGGTSWFGVQAVRSNANTIELVTGALSAAPAYAWELSVNALTHVRVRATAVTSGTSVWRIQPGAYATEPIPAAQVTAAQPVSGTVNNTPTTPTIWTLNSAATTNLTALKASAGTLYTVSISNLSASPRYLKLYNKTTAPVLASDIPVMVIPIAANSFATYEFGAMGQRFGIGIAYAITGAQADTDATAIGAGEIRLFGAYI